MSKRKNPSNSENKNEDFCDFLMELANYEKNINNNIHKYNVYRKAASVLSTHPKRIESGEEAKKLNGIGEKISKKIDEFLQTGKLRKLENIHDDKDAATISLLTRVSGIGPVKAREFVRNGIKTLHDLENIKSKLTHHQTIGLQYFEDFEKKIPRSEIEEIEKILKSTICEIDEEFTVTICGSYRRGKAESGDIDMLLTHPSIMSTSGPKSKEGAKLLKNVVNVLQSGGFITDTISLGETKFMTLNNALECSLCCSKSLAENFAEVVPAIEELCDQQENVYTRGASQNLITAGVCRIDKETPARRLDIRLTPYDQYHCATLYFTGSDVFNKTMRTHALAQGFTLNEYTLRTIGSTGIAGEAAPITSEEDIFAYIDFPYKKPNERNL